MHFMTLSQQKYQISWVYHSFLEKEIILKADRLCRHVQIISRVGYSNELPWIWISTAEGLVHPKNIAVCVKEGAHSGAQRHRSCWQPRSPPCLLLTLF